MKTQDELIVTTRLPLYAPYKIVDLNGEPVIEGCTHNMTWVDPLEHGETSAVRLLNAVRDIDIGNEDPFLGEPKSTDPEVWNVVWERFTTTFHERCNRASVLQFCNDYGLFDMLGAYSMHVPHTPPRFSEEEVKVLGLACEPLGTYRQTLNGFCEQVWRIKHAISALVWLQSPEAEKADSTVIFDKKQAILTLLRYYWRGITLLPILAPGPKPGLNFRLQYTTLSQAVGIALYLVMTGGGILRTCKNPSCGRLFIARSPRQKFCPAPDNYSRSPCENNYHQMLHRKRKKHQKGEKSNGKA